MGEKGLFCLLAFVAFNYAQGSEAEGFSGSAEISFKGVFVVVGEFFGREGSGCHPVI